MPLISIIRLIPPDLRVLEIGGNEIGESVELALKDLKAVHPELDVARDKPKGNDSHHAWQEV